MNSSSAITLTLNQKDMKEIQSYFQEIKYKRYSATLQARDKGKMSQSQLWSLDIKNFMKSLCLTNKQHLKNCNIILKIMKKLDMYDGKEITAVQINDYFVTFSNTFTQFIYPQFQKCQVIKDNLKLIVQKKILQDQLQIRDYNGILLQDERKLLRQISQPKYPKQLSEALQYLAKADFKDRNAISQLLNRLDKTWKAPVKSIYQNLKDKDQKNEQMGRQQLISQTGPSQKWQQETARKEIQQCREQNRQLLLLNEELYQRLQTQQIKNQKESPLKNNRDEISKRDELSRDQQKANSLQLELRKVKQTLKTVTEKYEEEVTKVTHMQQLLHQCQRDIPLKDQIADLLRQLDQEKCGRRKVNYFLKQVQQQLDDTKDELNTFKQDRTNQAFNKIANLRQNQKLLRENLSLFEKNNQQLKQRVAKLEQSTLSFAELQLNYRQMQNENTRLREAEENCRQRFDNLIKDLERRQQQQQRQMIKGQAVIQSNCKESREPSLQKQNRDLKDQLHQKQQLYNSIVTKNMQNIKNSEEKITYLTIQIAEYQDQLRQRQDSDSLQSLRAKIERLQQENAQMTSEISQCKIAIYQKEKQINQINIKRYSK